MCELKKLLVKLLSSNDAKWFKNCNYLLTVCEIRLACSYFVTGQ